MDAALATLRVGAFFGLVAGFQSGDWLIEPLRVVVTGPGWRVSG